MVCLSTEGVLSLPLCYVNDLDAAPLERRIRDVQNMAKVSTVTSRSVTLGVAVGPRQYITHQLLGKADVIRARHERVHLCQDPQTEFALRESLGVSPCESTATQSFRNSRLQKSTTRLGSGLLKCSQVSRRTLWRESHSVLACPESGTKRARDIAAPAHLGALIAAKPRIQAMIRDGVWAGLLPEHLLETRFAALIGKPTSTYLSAHDDEDQATATLYIQKTAQASDEAWQHTIAGLQGPGVANPTIASLEHPGSASLDEDNDEMDLSAPWKSRLSAAAPSAAFTDSTQASEAHLSKAGSK